MKRLLASADMTVWVHVRILLEVALDIGDAIPYSERSVPCMGYVEVEAIWWPKCVFPLALNRRFAVQILVRLEYKLVVVKTTRHRDGVRLGIDPSVRQSCIGRLGLYELVAPFSRCLHIASEG